MTTGTSIDLNGTDTAITGSGGVGFASNEAPALFVDNITIREFQTASSTDTPRAIPSDSPVRAPNTAMEPTIGAPRPVCGRAPGLHLNNHNCHIFPAVQFLAERRGEPCAVRDEKHNFQLTPAPNAGSNWSQAGFG